MTMTYKLFRNTCITDDDDDDDGDDDDDDDDDDDADDDDPQKLLIAMYQMKQPVHPIFFKMANSGWWGFFGAEGPHQLWVTGSPGNHDGIQTMHFYKGKWLCWNFWVVKLQIFFIFTPNLAERIQFLTHIFQMGWEKTTN